MSGLVEITEKSRDEEPSSPVSPVVGRPLRQTKTCRIWYLSRNEGISAGLSLCSQIQWRSVGCSHLLRCVYYCTIKHLLEYGLKWRIMSVSVSVYTCICMLTFTCEGIRIKRGLPLCVLQSIKIEEGRLIDGEGHSKRLQISEQGRISLALDEVTYETYLSLGP